LRISSLLAQVYTGFADSDSFQISECLHFVKYILS